MVAEKRKLFFIAGANMDVIIMYEQADKTVCEPGQAVNERTLAYVQQLLLSSKAATMCQVQINKQTSKAVYDLDEAYSSDQCQNLHRTMHRSTDGGTGVPATTMFHGSTAETHRCLQREHCQSLWATWQRAAWRPPASQASPVDPAQKAADSTSNRLYRYCRQAACTFAARQAPLVACLACLLHKREIAVKAGQGWKGLLIGAKTKGSAEQSQCKHFCSKP